MIGGGWRAALSTVLVGLAALPAWAQEPPGELGRVIDCRAAAEFAELAEGLPPGLLLAIGKIETGRPDPETGKIEPWPWSTDQGGQGHYFGSAQEAIAWTTSAQAAGLHSIDVGCFQINLLYHPEAFASLDEAFDPVANALYAARFLAALYRRAGGWPLAVAQYHSADPALGLPYGDRVYGAWNGTGPTAGVYPRGSGPAVETAGMARPGLVARLGGGPDPYVVRLSVRALGVRVVLPSWAVPAPPSGGSAPGPAAGRSGSPAAPPTVTVPAAARVAAGGGPVTADPYSVRLPRGTRLPKVFRPAP